MHYTAKFRDLEDKVEICKKVISLFIKDLSKPIFYDSGIIHKGYRYANPTILHFCVLKAVRAISGFNACIVLGKEGYIQEICVIIRSVIDAKTQIEFILSGYQDGTLKEIQQKHLDRYFSDFKRNSAADLGTGGTRQKDIHDEVSSHMEETFMSLGCEGYLGREKTSALMSNVYKAYSGYVHAAYPEVMDMWGGTPGQFHMDGMKNTPKDDEIYRIISTFLDSLDLCLINMILNFGYKEKILSDKELEVWYRKHIE